MGRGGSGEAETERGAPFPSAKAPHTGRLPPYEGPLSVRFADTSPPLLAGGEELGSGWHNRVALVSGGDAW
ncbi:hypothetical protein MPLDJ20_140381 [Mesorhizobium plurifarium]|uniref:Uncharacterized protein n=1 Tax=Mesorhizobium plurifarium TaxID=69974 RepID=A0A090ELC0_MESPL|nr:hypothetical protein MPLDJ20_140381 [Mesorhizobium plurifarium]